jgi:hypothetical protein
MKAKDRTRKRAGQVIALAPVMLVVLVLFLALTADVGQLFLWRARLQNTADASALAAMHTLVAQRLGGAGEEPARAVALSEAAEIHEANAGRARCEVEFGILNEGGSFAAAGAGTTATLVRTRAHRDSEASDGPVPLAFTALIGISGNDVHASAVAEVTANIRGVTVGLCPFAVPEWRVLDAGIGGEIVFYPADGEDYDGLGDASVVPGCWGLLNLDGGDLGTSELIDFIVNGYPAAFEVDSEDGYIWIDGTSGFRAALQDTMEQRIGDSLIVLLYDQVIGTGSNAEFRCVGFMSMTITEVQLTGNNPHMTCTIDETGTLYHLISGGGHPSFNILKIQLIE